MSAVGVVLTGPSSSGKSALAERLRQGDTRPWLVLDADRMLSAFSWHHFPDSPARATRRLNAALFASMRACLGEGLNVVCEQVFWAPDLVYDAADRLAASSTWLVRLTAADDELARREHQRGDRAPGTSRHQRSSIDWTFPVDLELDTTDVPVEELVNALLRLLEGTKPRALSDLQHRSAG